MPKGVNRGGKPQGSHARQGNQNVKPASYRSQGTASHAAHDSHSNQAFPPSQGGIPVTNQSASQYSRDSYGSAARAQKSKGGVWRVVFVLSIVVLVGALAALGAIGYQYWSQQNAYNDLEQYAQVEDDSNLALSDLKVDWDALRAINPDIVAWVFIPDTPINYPVVQGSDNEEYLHKAFDGSTGWLASAGTIFLDAANSSDLTDRNNALYGHHMNDGSMFASLADFENQDTFNSHRDIYVLTPQGNYRLKTFALVKTTGSDAIVQTSFSNDASYQSYVQDKLNRSVVTQKDNALAASDVKQSMLFSTCEYSQNDGRAVLFAAVVETTAANDPYLSTSTSGSTGLSSSQDAVMDRKYEEAA